MNNFPEHLAPWVAGHDGNKVPFQEWWPIVKDGFPNVPEIVAQELLYRHWGGSGFYWVPSHSYNFSLEKFPSDKLCDVLNRVHDFEPGGALALKFGEQTCRKLEVDPKSEIDRWLVNYMQKNHDFPAPIIILDNCDNHLLGHPQVPQMVDDHPKGLILVEGHSRHEIGLYLRSINQLKDNVQVCRLKLI